MTDKQIDATGETDLTATGKGRPTPKRKDQEKARHRGLIADPRQDAKARRAKMREQREREYQAMRTGDERNMGPEHRGPERRFLRDYVDARTTLSEFLLPLAILFVIASLFTQALGVVGIIMVMVFYVLVLVAAVETYLTVRRAKKYFVAKFGENRLPRGWSFYVISRAMNLRRFRTPKPKVARGDYPV